MSDKNFNKLFKLSYKNLNNELEGGAKQEMNTQTVVTNNTKVKGENKYKDINGLYVTCTLTDDNEIIIDGINLKKKRDNGNVSISGDMTTVTNANNHIIKLTYKSNTYYQNFNTKQFNKVVSSSTTGAVKIKNNESNINNISDNSIYVDTSSQLQRRKFLVITINESTKLWLDSFSTTSSFKKSNKQYISEDIINFIIHQLVQYDVCKIAYCQYDADCVTHNVVKVTDTLTSYIGPKDINGDITTSELVLYNTKDKKQQNVFSQCFLKNGFLHHACVRLEPRDSSIKLGHCGLKNPTYFQNLVMALAISDVDRLVVAQNYLFYLIEGDNDDNNTQVKKYVTDSKLKQFPFDNLPDQSLKFVTDDDMQFTTGDDNCLDNCGLTISDLLYYSPVE